MINRKDKEILEVVTFLFRNYLQSDGQLPKDQAAMSAVLQQVGFSKKIIYKALDWLSGLAEQQIDLVAPDAQSIRIFTTDECVRLSVECRNHIMLLEQDGVLNPLTREVVINQLQRLPHYPIELSDLKWVTLVVLYSYPDQRQALIKLEQIILQ